MQSALAIRNEPHLLSTVDLRSLEWLTVEPLIDDLEPAASEISEQRRMAIVLLLSEISVLREHYDFPN